MKEKQKGGVRKGAGRKPSTDPKQPITIFVETSKIESFGGKEGVQLFCYAALDSANPISVSGPVFTGIKLPEPQPSYVKKEKEKSRASDAPAAPLKLQEQPKTNNSTDTRPKTLDELKKLCPAELEGFDRSKWIATERQKYGI
jgi:hypothetical protein